MDLETETPRQTIEELRNRARITRESVTATIIINGRKCTVTASPPGRQIESKTSEGLQSLEGKIDAAGCITSGISRFSLAIAEYTQPISIDSRGMRSGEICKFLNGTANFVLQNDLTSSEISTLKQRLRQLCSMPIIKSPNGDFPINECDSDPHCRAIALQAEFLEILLDAKARGQVGLERNIPPPLQELGRGAFNTVSLAHTKPGVNGGKASGPIALKPCDQSKRKIYPATFAGGIQFAQGAIGTASGSYRRNLATSKVQDMLCEIGQGKGIEVPHVIASVSAAEMNGVPCIAIEMVDGQTLRNIAKTADIILTNEFMRREAWIQLQDVLTGQIDRHESNVMMRIKNVEDVLPVAIDHDFSFPTNPPRDFADKVPEKIVLLKVGTTRELAIDGKSPRNYCMPPIIDQEMYDVIMAIDLPRLKAMYQECGLTRPEISAAMARAQGLQAAARQLMEDDHVIEPNRWTSLPVLGYCNERNFYATRHSRRK